ncbi:ATP-binding protein [Leeuwenhoekiella sp. H156]|uniref:ATP-binding protein n=1 Tax=Leeuwenhoekiella sp. H156 TaxID=3450128 RepID=UPI003FA4CB0B
MSNNGFLSIFSRSAIQSPDAKADSFYYEQIAKVTQAGGWNINFTEKKTYFDKELQAILETPENYRPSLRHALHFFDMEYHSLVIKTFQELGEGGADFDGVLKMVTYTNKAFWAHCIAKPIVNSRGRVIGIKGIVININEKKERELMLQKAIEVVEANNSRLFTFANYVSHNIKSHVNNLELTSQLVDTNKLPQDQKELFVNYKEIAASLNRTVSRLKEVVSIQNKASDPLVSVSLEEAFEKAREELRPLIELEEAYLYSDFSETPIIRYNPEFLHNIFCTLIKNGIVNKSPDRKPEIKAYCLENKKKLSLIIEDNGKGYDLQGNTDKIFQMSSSETSNSDTSQNVGLFIVKNEVEALGGKIDVTSKPGYGTKFIIML